MDQRFLNMDLTPSQRKAVQHGGHNLQLITSTLPATPALRKRKACDYRGMCTEGRDAK